MNADRFTLTVDEYLAEKNVLFYMEDAVNQLLEHKEEYTQFGIARYFAEYLVWVPMKTEAVNYVKEKKLSTATPLNGIFEKF